MPFRVTRRSLFQGAGLLAVSSGPAYADKAADTLRIDWRDTVPQMDPYRSGLHAVLVLAAHIFDTLVYRDADTLQIKPLLATAWHSPNSTTLDLTLRPDVLFHDGTTVSADDVVYSVQVANTTGGPAALDFPVLAGAEATGPLQVRLHLQQPVPLALEYLATVLPVLPRTARERAGGGFGDAPIGSGPYRFDGKTEDSITLAAFSDYFSGGPKGKPAIGRLVFHTVADNTTAITDLIKGDSDWISGFDPSQFPALARAPTLDAVQIDSMRIGYMSIDVLGRSDLARPFMDSRVRQALACAIDRGALARQFGSGAGHVLDAACNPTQFGCDVEAATKYPYDPTRARRLLADAGFPDGFATTLVSYVLPQWSGGVQNYLRAVGIDVAVQQVQPNSAARLLLAGQAPLMLGTWGSAGINDVAGVLPHFFAGGPMDQVRDADLIDLMGKAGQTADPDRRRALYSDAIRRISASMWWLPMFAMSATYAFSKTLAFHATSDEIPQFYAASWK